MNKRYWFRSISVLLIPLFLLSSMQLDCFAAVGTGGVVRKAVNSVIMAHYQHSYDAFINEVRLTMRELSIINKRLGGDIESSEEVSMRLKIIKTLDGKTSLIKRDIKDIRDVSFILSAIPQVRTPMNKLHEKSKKAVNKLENFEDRIKPLHKKATTFKQRILLKGLTYRYELVKYIKDAQAILNQQLLDSAKQMDDYIRTAALCASIDNDLSNVSNALDKLTASLALFRKGLSAINKRLSQSSSVLLKINATLRMFKPFKVELLSLNKLLKKIRVGLKLLMQQLRRRIKLKFTFNPPWGKLVSFRISIKLQDILKGPAVLIRKIKAALDDFLWKIAKAIGIKNIIKKFMAKAKSIVKGLLSKLHFKFPFKFHGFGGGDGIDIRLLNLFDKLKGIYLLPDLPKLDKPSFDVYLGYLPHFRDLAFCSKLKETDLAVESVSIDGTIRRGHKSIVNVVVADHQDASVVDMIKKATGGKSVYSYKAVVSLQATDGYRYTTDEFVINAARTVSINIPWIPQTKGKVDLSATVSIVGVNEKDLKNNLKSITVDVLPYSVDLALKSINVDEDLIESEQADVYVVVSNLNLKHSAMANLRVTVDDGFEFTEKEVVLDAGRDESFDISWTPKKSGEHVIKAEVLPINEKQDPVLKNNTLERKVMVRKHAIDLSIESVKKDEKIYEGRETKIMVTVKNNGPKDTDGSTRLIVKSDDGYKKAMRIDLPVNKIRSFVYKWTPKKSGPVQMDIEIVSELGDLNPGDNSKLITIDVKPDKSHISAYNAWLNRWRRLFNSLGITDNVKADFEGLNRSIVGVLDKLRNSYIMGDKSRILGLFSREFPDYLNFVHAIQEDIMFFHNISMFYRIDSISFSPEKNKAMANVFWKIQFMMNEGRIYRKSANIRMKFVKDGQNWRIAGMVNNNIFGQSLLSYIDLYPILSSLNVYASGADVILSGINIGNKGNEVARNFNVSYTYRRATGQVYTGSSLVSALRPNSMARLNFKIKSAAFIPGIGDTLTIAVDPTKSLPEINRSNNKISKKFPF